MKFSILAVVTTTNKQDYQQSHAERPRTKFDVLPMKTVSKTEV